MRISLDIPSMKSHHCQMTVWQAVSASGGKIIGIAPTKIVVEPGIDASKETIIAAIEKAGYRVQSQS